MTALIAVCFAVASTAPVVALSASLAVKVGQMDQRIDMLESRIQSLAESPFDLERKFYDYASGSDDDDDDHRDRDGDDDEYHDPFDDDQGDQPDTPVPVSLPPPALGSV